jgi:hypothetical protein
LCWLSFFTFWSLCWLSFFTFWSLCWLSFFTASDYPFSILKIFLKYSFIFTEIYWMFSIFIKERKNILMYNCIKLAMHIWKQKSFYLWFPPSTNKTDHDDITEILLKVTLNTIIMISLKYYWKLR